MKGCLCFSSTWFYSPHVPIWFKLIFKTFLETAALIVRPLIISRRPSLRNVTTCDYKKRARGESAGVCLRLDYSEITEAHRVNTRKWMPSGLAKLKHGAEISPIWIKAKGRDALMRQGVMRSVIKSFDGELRLFSKMARICSHANALFAKMT